MLGAQLSGSTRALAWTSGVRCFLSSCPSWTWSSLPPLRPQPNLRNTRELHWDGRVSPIIPLTLHHPHVSTFARSISSSPNVGSKMEDLDRSPAPEATADQDNQEAADDDEEGMAGLSPEELQELTDGDPELIKKLQFIQMEHELLRQDGRQVPSVIKFRRWQELLHLESRSQRQKYFLFLWKTEMKSLSDRKKKEEMQRRRREELGALPPRPTDEEDPHGMFYGLNKNTLFLRLYDTRVNSFFHNRVIQAMRFGPPLVLDCGYDEHMTLREAKNCAAQLELLLTDNRLHPEPLNLTLCNADPRSKMMEALLKRIPTLYNADYAVNLSERSYVELFPKDRLVYLSPHAREELAEFREDEIYIVGAMVDKTDPRPLSLAKAKKDGLRMKKLPLDRYMDWGLGGKSLTVNQMGNIILDLRHTRDWDKALRFVPRRKLRRYEDEDSAQNSPSAPRTPFRPQRESQVLTDFELAKKRKGFRTDNNGNSNYSPGSSSGGRPFQKHNMKTILSDY